MTQLPYQEWNLADVWQAIHTQPRRLVRSQDKRGRGGQLVLPINSDAFIAFNGDPENGISEADLIFPKMQEHGGGGMVSAVREQGVMFMAHALSDPDLTNQFIWPYTLDVIDGVWCITNQKKGVTKLFNSGQYFQLCEPLTDEVREEIRSLEAMIQDYVNSINVTNMPAYTLCEGCEQGDGPHLIYHIARKEASQFILHCLAGYEYNSGQWTEVHKQHLSHVLKKLVITPAIDYRIIFAIPPSIIQWLRHVPWSERNLLELKKLK